MEHKLTKLKTWDEDKENSEKGPPKRTLSWNENYATEKQEKSTKFAQLRQRRKSIAPDMSLPPIDENKNVNSTKSLSDSSGREVTFNRGRRASVASTTALYTHWSAASTDSTPDSLLRRGSWTNQPRGAYNRRSSIAANLLGRKASFRTIGTRVTTLLRAKNAFVRLKKKPTFRMDDDVEKVPDFDIKELPKQPRFASTLSAEAQYAIMKGYEDVVHNYLCNTYPEYRNLLRRSRTPQGGVSVKSDKKDKQKDQHEDDGSEDNVDGAEGSHNEIVTSTPLPGHTASPESLISTKQINGTAASPRALSRTVSHLPSRTAPRNLARYSSLPNIAPSKDRQLVMTYRYQCAMDILDNIKQQMGLHPLSPRVKDRKATPVKEFNSWSYGWNKEFEVK